MTELTDEEKAISFDALQIWMPNETVGMEKDFMLIYYQDPKFKNLPDGISRELFELKYLLIEWVRKAVQWDPDYVYKPHIPYFSVLTYKIKNNLLYLAPSLKSDIKDLIVVKPPTDFLKLLEYRNNYSGFTTEYVKSASYEEMFKSVSLEEICKGRQACILADYINYKWFVCRSTTEYKNRPERIRDIHHFRYVYPNDKAPRFRPEGSKLREPAMLNVQEEYGLNIMFEVYDERYQSMSYHSDMSIDLDGPIKILSLYPADEKRRRELHIKNKQTSEVTKIVLQDHMVVAFDLDTNKKFLHRIVGQAQWMGLTYRISKTLSASLRLATESEKRALLFMRSQENNLIDYKYPNLDYTLNPTDLVKYEPKHVKKQ